MKEIEISQDISTFIEAMEANLIRPNGDERVDVEIVEQRLSITTNESYENIKEIYLIAYDRENNDILAYQEMEELSTNKFEVELSDDFVEKINALEVFKYARLCIAMRLSEKNHFFFLKDCLETEYDDLTGYVGVLRGDGNCRKDSKLVAYFSWAGTLSIKYVSTKDYIEKYCKCTIEEIAHSGNVLKLNLDCIRSASEEIGLVLVSCSNNKILYDIPVDVVSKTKMSKTRELVEYDITFLPIYDKYYLAYKMGDNILKVTVSDGCIIDELLDTTFCANEAEEDEFNILYSLDKNRQVNINVAKRIYPYIFSIVMAVYNTEQFLEEALDSLAKQDIGALKEYVIGNPCKEYKKQVYRDVFEVIMVDDGATDSSGQICDAYAERYPHFRVIHKENGGVSSARNRGIEMASGKYLNFMDSDDKFSNNVLVSCFRFFEKNYDKTDIITFPPKIFDGGSGDHWLNEKFSKGERIIKLMDEYDKNVLLVNASFFKSEKIKNKIKFEESLKIGEDVRFIYSLYFNGTAKFGVTDKCTYWYRRRSSGEKSAIQAAKSASNYYCEFLTECIDWLLSESNKTYGFIPRFILYVIMQQLQWRFVEDTDASLVKGAIGEDEFREYVEHMKKELQYIDDDIIMMQKKIYREQKKYILELKYGETVKKYYEDNDIHYFCKGTKLATASTNYLRLEFLKLGRDSIYVEGYNMSYEKDVETYIKINDEFILLNSYKRDKSVYSLGEPIFYATPFIYKGKLDRDCNEYSISFYEKIDGNYIMKKDLRYAKTLPLSQKFTKSYFVDNDWGAKIQNANIKIKNLQNIATAMKYYTDSENEFIKQLTEKCTTEVEKKAIELRKELMAFKANFKKDKQIWLVSDRVNLAGDNGEAFFRYLMDKNDPDIDVYFVINKDSKDYEDMCQVGKVVIQNSKEHKVLHFLADYVISSQGNEYIINPFVHEGTTDIFRDMVYKPKFVFLQHGVIKDDLSGWLNRFNKDMTGLVTAATPEYQSILDYDYFYTPKEVWLTGLPRHDRLYRDDKKYVTIMPTWRKYLSVRSENDPEINVVVDNFEESDFFKFYNELINHRRLIDEATRLGYTICFMPHPNIMNNLEMFDHDPAVKFFGTEKPYREIYAESSLVMTDYSSSIMDFAYLRQPLVYCHFDAEDFFAGDHVYVRGYFEYERDGFGEVTYDVESLVDVMVEYMENGCQLKDVYKERMDNFFAYNDHNNCERLYKRIKEDN